MRRVRFPNVLLLLAAPLLAQTSRPASRPATRPASRPDPAQAQAERLGRELTALFARLASERTETSQDARDAIIALCQRERIARLGYETERLYAFYRQFWREQATVTAEVRLQNTTLLGLDTVPVSLGLGRPVQLQLPRSYQIRLGTTVTLPAGR